MAATRDLTRRDFETTTDELAGAGFGKVQTFAGGMAVVGLVLAGLGLVMQGETFWQSYLYALIYWTGVSAGALALLLVHHTVGGGWGYLIRRFLEAAAHPYMFLLLLVAWIPVLLPMHGWGLHSLYHHWAGPEAASDPILQAKRWWLNEPFFMARTPIYLLIWAGFAAFVRKWGDTQDQRRDMAVFDRLNRGSAFGIVCFVITVTAAITDWVMSLVPHWVSTILGLLATVTFALSAMATMVFLLGFLGGDHPLLQTVRDRRPNYFRDLGNLMMAMVLLWGYMSLSQYLIQFSGNTAEDAVWWMPRRQGPWGVISLSLIVVHFALPFGILLIPGQLKERPKRLMWVALWLVLARVYDVCWWVTPSLREQFFVTAADFGMPLFFGGIWLFHWVNFARGRRLLPAHDPRVLTHWHEVIHHRAVAHE